MAKAAAAAKKPDNLQFQIEVENEMQWRSLLRREGLILIDVYASWAGPCASMVSILKRVKVEINDDRLWYGLACSDNIDDLLMFKDQSEPTWLFIGGGKPVRVFRGSHTPNLITAIKQEFEHEINCIEGKARRNFISIDDEVSRKKKTEAEASRLAKMVVEEDEAAAEALNDLRRDSSISLMGCLEPYTVAVIQPFVIEAGSAQEIKDFLMGDFKILEEISLDMTEDIARNFYRIPYEIPDPVQDFGYSPEMEDIFADDDQVNEEDEDAPAQQKPKKLSKPKIKTIQIPLPDGLVGETIVLLMEVEEIKALADKGEKPTGTLLQTADDYIRLKVGPVNYADALEHAPYSLHAAYGKGENQPGIWCPRKYDDKRYVILNFFPKFVQNLLSITPIEGKKYFLAVLPVTAAEQMADNYDVEVNKKDILAEGKMKIPMDIADEMLQSWNVQGGDLMTKKAQLTTGPVYVVSINRKNSALKTAITSFAPVHVSFDNTTGRRETAKLFKRLNLPIDEETAPEEVFEKFLARSAPRIHNVMDIEDLPLVDPLDLLEEDNEGEGESGEEEEQAAAGDKPHHDDEEEEDEEEN